MSFGQEVCTLSSCSFLIFKMEQKRKIELLKKQLKDKKAQDKLDREEAELRSELNKNSTTSKLVKAGKGIWKILKK